MDALKLSRKQRSGASISTAVGQATRHWCLNITQSCGRAKTRPGGRGKDGRLMISSQCWHVGRLTRGRRSASQSVVNFNGQLTSSQQRCPPRHLPSGPPNRRCPKVLFRSFNKAKGLCPTQSSEILSNFRGEKSKLLRSSPFTSLPPPPPPPSPPRPREKPLPQS